MEFLKKLRSFDLIIIGIVLVCVLVGILTFAGKRATSSKQIEGTSNVEIEVFFKGITLSAENSPFVEGDETFVTIRNVPYTKLKITKVTHQRRQAIVATGNQQKPLVLVDDLTSPLQYDFLVTIVDEGKMTKDGIVVGGNKMKMGLPVTLEGVDYRFNGIVSNVTLNIPSENKDKKKAE